MTTELREKSAEFDALTFSDEKIAPPSRRRTRKDIAPEIASEMLARRRAIGVELRRIYDGVAREPVPEEFRVLMNQIDRKLED